jgi:hypothetical protein
LHRMSAPSKRPPSRTGVAVFRTAGLSLAGLSVDGPPPIRSPQGFRPSPTNPSMSPPAASPPTLAKALAVLSIHNTQSPRPSTGQLAIPSSQPDLFGASDFGLLTARSDGGSRGASSRVPESVASETARATGRTALMTYRTVLDSSRGGWSQAARVSVPQPEGLSIQVRSAATTSALAEGPVKQGAETHASPVAATGAPVSVPKRLAGMSPLHPSAAPSMSPRVISSKTVPAAAAAEEPSPSTPKPTVTAFQGAQAAATVAPPYGSGSPRRGWALPAPQTPAATAAPARAAVMAQGASVTPIAVPRSAHNPSASSRPQAVEASPSTPKSTPAVPVVISPRTVISSAGSGSSTLAPAGAGAAAQAPAAASCSAAPALTSPPDPSKPKTAPQPQRQGQPRLPPAEAIILIAQRRAQALGALPAAAPAAGSPAAPARPPSAALIPTTTTSTPASAAKATGLAGAASAFAAVSRAPTAAGVPASVRPAAATFDSDAGSVGSHVPVERPSPLLLLPHQVPTGTWCGSSHVSGPPGGSGRPSARAAAAAADPSLLTRPVLLAPQAHVATAAPASSPLSRPSAAPATAAGTPPLPLPLAPRPSSPLKSYRR